MPPWRRPGSPGLFFALAVNAAARIEHDPLADGWSLAYDAAWVAAPKAFPLSPPLPLVLPKNGDDARSIKRFIEHLLPEGRALDDALATNGLARSNVFGLIRALGTETAGILRLRDAAQDAARAGHTPREVSVAELDARITAPALPFTVWDGKVRMSIAGVQDKLLVYLDAPLSEGGRMFLVDGPRLAVNEHFCMRLARRIGLPVADVDLLRTPHPTPRRSPANSCERSRRLPCLSYYTTPYCWRYAATASLCWASDGSASR